MNIANLKAYVAKVIYGSGEVWDFLFFQSINNVVRDLRSYTRIDIDEIDETDPPDTLSIDFQYQNLFLVGVPYHMQRSPLFARQSGQEHNFDYRSVLAQVQADEMNSNPPDVGWHYDDED